MIAAKQRLEMKFVLLLFFSIKVRYSDILLKNINIIYSADRTFRVIKIMEFNRVEPTCYRNNFLTPVPANKIEIFRIQYYAYCALRTHEA